MLEGFVRRIYGKKFDVKHDIDAQAWREVLRIMNEATVEGIMQSDEPPTRDMDFYKALRHSNEVFSAFKVHTMGKEMAAKLTGENGKLKPFSEWRRDIEGIASHQVGSWLQTEYNTAVVRAHAAADWQQYERDKDVMPMLRWMPTTSAEPELTHRKFWNAKVNLPIDDPFWTKHYPGDHWNCKCSLEQNDDPAVRTNTDMDDVPQRGLEGNPGITKEIFSDKHPYFATSCDKCFAHGESSFKEKLCTVFTNQKEKCNNCTYIDKVCKKNTTKAGRMVGKQGMSANLSRLRETSGKEYLDTLIAVTQSKEFKAYEGMKNVFWTGNAKDSDLPRILDASRKCVALGYKVYILPNPHGIRTADLILMRKNIYKEFDLKTIYGSNSVNNDLVGSAGQTTRVLLNMVNTSYNSRRLAKDIKDYFESVPEAREVMILKNKKEILIPKEYVKKDFIKNFMKIYK